MLETLADDPFAALRFRRRFVARRLVARRVVRWSRYRYSAQHGSAKYDSTTWVFTYAGAGGSRAKLSPAAWKV